jgi:hypothetical protein
MKRVHLLLMLCSISLHPMGKKTRKRKHISETQILNPRQCPYCDTSEDDLSDHLLNNHKIDSKVLPECLVAITAFNAIKNSRYDIADIPCVCNRSFRSIESLLKHQKSKYSCPARGLHVQLDAPCSAETVEVKVESPPLKPLPRRSTRTARFSSKNEEYYGDRLLDEIMNLNKNE